VFGARNLSEIFAALQPGNVPTASPGTNTIQKSLVCDRGAKRPSDRGKHVLPRYPLMKDLRFSSVFDRLDLSKVLRPIPIAAFKPIPGLSFSPIARCLKDAFAPLENLRASLSYLDALAPPTSRPASRRDVADSIRSTAVTVSVDRTEWELDQIADRLLSKTKRKRRHGSAAVSDADGESAEPNVCAPVEAEGDELAEERNVAPVPRETLLKAIELLKKHELRTYESTRLALVVEHMVECAEMLILAGTFDEAKKEIRSWRKVQPVSPRPQGKLKNEGQLPTMSTLNQVINSLEPIYQELLETMRSELAAANSEVANAA
jgi:hypothetical protein